jgi:hypothetical protein
VEIDYDGTMNCCWTRYVVCKEICHALETDPNVRIQGFDQVEKLIGSFMLANPAPAMVAFPQFGSEKIAEFLALELLCPVRDRVKIVEARKTTEISDMQLATEFRVPLIHVKGFFDPAAVGLMAKILA